jgi:hypothetical protein
MSSECFTPRSNYAKLKNTGCWKPYQPLAKATIQPPPNCLHQCGGCNMKTAPCPNRCCGKGMMGSMPMKPGTQVMLPNGEQGEVVPAIEMDMEAAMDVPVAVGPAPVVDQSTGTQVTPASMPVMGPQPGVPSKETVEVPSAEAIAAEVRRRMMMRRRRRR